MKQTLPARNELLQAALCYRARGWSVIPVTINRVKENWKKAGVEWRKLQVVIRSPEQVEAMFRVPDLTGVAVVLGPVSGGLGCRDFDHPEAYAAWAAEFPEEARRLPTVATARGFHVYFRHGESLRIKKLADGELRCGGGYAILPPSVHHTGHVYRWKVELPDELVPVVDLFGIGLDRNYYRTEKAEFPERSEQTETTEQPERTEVTNEYPCHPRREGEPGGFDVGKVVEPAIPAKAHENNARLFTLARSVLAVEKGLGRKFSYEELRTAFAEWYRRVASKGLLREGQSRDEYWMEFMRGLENAKYPLGEGTLPAAWEAAQRGPPPKIAEQFEDPAVRRLVALCRELQRAAGDKPFYLSCRIAQGLLNLPTHRKANDWLRALASKRVKIIEEVEKGSAKTHHASRFRYLPPLDE